MLFDMINDPWEQVNLAEKPHFKDVIAQHEQMLRVYEEKIIPGHAFTRK
jgi:N-dimethylarginine dimethylaminohydrolase